VQCVSDDVDPRLSGLGEDPDVVEETQFEDSVANIVVTPVGHVSETSECEDTTSVLEVSCLFYEFAQVYINLTRELVDLFDGKEVTYYIMYHFNFYFCLGKRIF